MGGLGQQFGETEPLGQRLGLPAPPALAGRQLQVGQHRHVGEEPRVLEHQADAAPLGQQVP
ncbi:hypothetical protein D3C78_1790370 [compost metagenome]